MRNFFRATAILGIPLFALFLADCSASGGEETVGSVFKEKNIVSADSSGSIATTDTPLSSQSSTGPSTDQPDNSSEQTSTYHSGSDGGSIKPTITCPSSHPILDWIGECHSCDEETSIDMSYEDQESCERLCNGKNGTTKRIYEHGDCRLEACPANKPLMDTWGDCRSCKYDGPIRDTTNCSKCSNRKIQNGYCVIASCEGRPLLDDDGFCYPCSTSLSVQTRKGECTSKCPNRRESGSWSWDDGTNKTEGSYCYYESEGSE